MRTYTNAELAEALDEALKRIEVLKQTQQVMATKAGLDWDAVCWKARQRIAAAERVEDEMEQEAAKKAAEPAS